MADPGYLSNSALAAAISALVDRWNTRENQMVQLLTQATGNVTVTDGLGENHSLPSYPSLQVEVSNLVSDAAGAVAVALGHANTALQHRNAAAQSAVDAATAATAATTLPLTGAVSRTPAERWADRVAPEEFGAVVGTGVDSSVALQKALSSGRPVDGGGRTYRLSSAIAVSVPFELRNITLDISLLPVDAVAISASGTLGATATVAAVAAGATTVTITDASAAPAVGSLIVLTSANTFTTQGTPVARAEWLRVKSVAGSVITIGGEVQDDYTASPVIYKPTVLSRVDMDGVNFIGGGLAKDHKAVTVQVADHVRFSRCSAREVGKWAFATVNCRAVQAENITGYLSQDGTAGFAYLVSMSGFCDSAQATNIVGHGFRHVVTAGGTSGVVRSYIVSNITGTAAKEATVDAHPSVLRAVFTNITHTASPVAGFADGIVSQALHTVVTDCVLDKVNRNGVFVQPQVEHRAPSVFVSGVRIRGVGSAAVAVDLQYTRIKATNVFVEACACPDATLRGIYITTGSLSAGIEHLRLSGNAMVGAGRQLELDTFVSVDSVEIIGGRYKTSSTTQECVMLNGRSAGQITEVRATGIHTSGGTTGLRVVNPTKVIASLCRFIGWTTNATTGITHDGTNVISVNNLTA